MAGEQTADEVVEETEDVTSEVTEPEVTYSPEWREKYVEGRKGDDKMLKQLHRFASPDAAIDSWFAMNNRMSSGELRSALPKDAKPDEITKWRSENGIPEEFKGYEVDLKGGLVPGEDDKEIVDTFLEAAHNGNYTPAQVNTALDWYYDNQERQTQIRHEDDESLRQEVEDKLRVEWGTDFRVNKAKIEAYLDGAPAGVKDSFFGARLSDGSPLASNMDILRFFVDQARQLNPTVTIVPGEGAEQVQNITDEMKTLMAASAAPKGTKEWESYWKGGGAARYQKLVEANAQIQKTASKGAG